MKKINLMILNFYVLLFCACAEKQPKDCDAYNSDLSSCGMQEECIVNTDKNICEKRLDYNKQCKNLSRSEFQCKKEKCQFDLKLKLCFEIKKINLSDLLVYKNYDEFTKTSDTKGGTGSGIKNVYIEKSSGKKYLFKENDTGGEPPWLEAYAGVLYKYLLDEHAPFVYFVRHVDVHTNKLYAAIEINDTFEDSWNFHAFLKNPLLKDKNGLALILVSSMLLAEVDLKGLGSANSNLGIVEKDGHKIYFKIDHGQSFHFGGATWVPEKFSFDEPKGRLLKIKNDDEFFKSLGFRKITDDKNFILNQEYLNAIRETAKNIAKIDMAQIEKILDFCEQQLKWANIDPLKIMPNAFKKDVSTSKTLFNKDQGTLKEAVLSRFEQLRSSLGL